MYTKAIARHMLLVSLQMIIIADTGSSTDPLTISSNGLIVCKPMFTILQISIFGSSKFELKYGVRIVERRGKTQRLARDRESERKVGA